MISFTNRELAILRLALTQGDTLNWAGHPDYDSARAKVEAHFDQEPTTNTIYDQDDPNADLHDVGPDPEGPFKEPYWPDRPYLVPRQDDDYTGTIDEDDFTRNGGRDR